jgi:hypothetical protein
MTKALWLSLEVTGVGREVVAPLTSKRTIATLLPPPRAGWGTWSVLREDTSNWWELHTLVEVLKREPIVTSCYRGKRLFYFTDNMVMYDVVRRGSSRNPALHRLV